MNARILALLLISTLATKTIVAESLNILHLAESEPTLKIRVECKKLKQEFSLDYKSDSGAFILPKEKATIHINKKDLPSCPIPVAKTGSIAILVEKEKSLAWHLIESKPSADKNALRIINLCEETMTVEVNKQRIEIESGNESDLGMTDKKRLSVKSEGSKAASITPEEPAAYLAILYPTDDGAKIRFIADR
jgi:hypothetical protein